MTSNKKAITCAETLAEYCKEQIGCQKCIFKKYGADRWHCHIGEPAWWDLESVAEKKEAKKRNNWYL